MKISQFFIYILIIIIAVGISIISDVYRLSITPTDTTFPLIHNHPEDYFSYLGYMHTGLEGKWFTTIRTTPEHFQPQFVYTFFVLLGHLARITGISLIWIYFTARILCGALLLIIVLSTIHRIFHTRWERLTACLLVFFGTGFWTVTTSNNTLSINQYMAFWSRFDPIVRTTFLPHHTISTSLGLLGLVLFSQSLQTRSIKLSLIAGFLGFFAGFIYHGTVTNIIGGIGMAVILLVIGRLLGIFRLPPLSNISKYILIGSLYIIFMILSLAYIFYLTKTTWPWTISSNLAGRFTFHVQWRDYILGLGPVFFLTLFGLPRIVSSGILPILLLGWALFPVVGLFLLVHLLPRFGNMPYLEATSYIPLGILAVFGLQTIIMTKRSKIIRALLIILFLGFFTPPIISSINYQMHILQTSHYNKFIPHEVLEGFGYLTINTPYQSNILSGGYMGPIIPAFTHNYVVYGDEINTYNSQEKHDDMITFFSQTNTDRAKQILKKYDVSYVFFSHDTDPPKEEFLKNLPLEKVFEKGRVVIYKVTVPSS